ncbi:hypothetical protein LEP1GSC150_0272 [Leptospira interrogans serovar Copenhageni str. LT2050]|uniref:Uncharacterized protein n=1 Tax=Leptospira interrogans serovar Copenhageni str. LT2050 TaxID=1001598 RepID=M3IQS3_LEPIT|nr:hypothetical protein LEP1GSC150_0272 [Leptospira interrogans serovar Copenhageni str. LT2050]
MGNPANTISISPKTDFFLLFFFFFYEDVLLRLLYLKILP